MVVLGDRVDRTVHRRVLALVRRLEAATLPGIREIVPAYTTVTAFFSPETDAEALRIRLEAMALTVAAEPDPPDHGAALPPLMIPTRYRGPDLEWVAERTGLAREEVIGLHAGREYEVFLLGFAPGFAYLGELDPRLRLPRRSAPRIRVPAGSVAIAGAQTAVYPLATPGGWHLIGQTDLVLFDSARDPPALLAPGRRVRFEPVP